VSWPSEVSETIKQLERIKRDLNLQYVGRERAIDLLVLATVTQEHLLLIGPPGTAKTGIINQFCELIQARGFTYLISRFTEPAELFGPLDLPAFQRGTYQIRTEGMLPQAEICFLDEVFQGSSPILNSLLTLINERLFHNGPVVQPVPLATLIGASNTLPEDPWLQAFADRFLLRLEVNPVDNKQLDDLLEHGWNLETERIRRSMEQAGAIPRVAPRIHLGEVTELFGRLVEVDLSGVRKIFVQILRELRSDNVTLSDRRVVKSMKLIAGAALLRNADVATEADLWPIEHIWSRSEESQTLREKVYLQMKQAGIDTPGLAPGLDEIIYQTEVLENEEKDLASEASIQAHLSELNELRRAIIRYHPKSHETRRRIELAIESAMGRLVT
jgi:MoxR-like ATPase